MGVVAGVVQARMGSTRLPGKVLADLGGVPVAMWSLERVRRARTVDVTVLATTTSPADDDLAAFARDAGFRVVRGSVDDVLDRYLTATMAVDADVCVRVTADCPFVSPEIIDRVVERLVTSGLDYCTTRLPPPAERTYPIGQDVEAATVVSLQRAADEGRERHHREHVTPYLYEHPELFAQEVLHTDAAHPPMRLTIDYPEDLESLRRIVDACSLTPASSWQSMLSCLAGRRDLREANLGLHQKTLDE